MIPNSRIMFTSKIFPMAMFPRPKSTNVPYDGLMVLFLFFVTENAFGEYSKKLSVNFKYR